MRGAIQRVAILVTAVGVGCSTTSVDLVFDEREDLSRYRSWDWLPDGLPTVDAAPGDAAGLDARLARLIERAFLDKGFERAGPGVDFLVSYRLWLRRREVVVDVPAAPYLLSSHHSSPSYWIERSVTATRIYQDMHLAIGVTGPGGRLVWRAELRRCVEGDSPPPLDEAVEALLRRFPRKRPREDGPERPRTVLGSATGGRAPRPPTAVEIASIP